MAKPKTHHLHIQLTTKEMTTLEQYTRGIYGAKNLLVRTLLKRFFKEQDLHTQKQKEASDEKG